MFELPTGTVTFLFTDLEGSTRLWEEHPEAMESALARHDSILQESVEAHSGVVFSRMGDGLAAAFASATTPGHQTTRPLLTSERTFREFGRNRWPNRASNCPYATLAR